MSIKNRPKIVPLLLAGAMLVTVVTPLILSQVSHAASLSEVAVRFDRMATSAQTTGTVCAKPSTVATEAFVQVVFPTGYTLGIASTFTVDTTTNTASWPAGAQTWPGILTATNVASQTVTFPSGELTVGTLYCFNWINSAAVQVKSSATPNNVGSVTTRSSVPADIDTESYSTASIANDQILVTATVPSLFSFALSGNSDGIGTLSTGSVSTSPTPRTATVNTNSKNGWMIWAKDSNTGLKSTSNPSAVIASTTPGTNSTLVANTPGYNTGATFTQTGGSQTPSIAAPFVGTLAGQGGGLDTTLRTLASSTGTAKDAVITLKNNVAIDATTAAASDYTDTITVVGAGLF